MPATHHSPEAQSSPSDAALSALLDGEASEATLDDILTPTGRETWDTYHLIGDVLRSSDLAFSPSADFQARLSRALEAELPIVAPMPPQRSNRPLKIRAMLAASVAGVALLLGVPYLYDEPSPAPSPRLAQLESPSVRSAPIVSGALQANLSRYMAAHREIAGPSARWVTLRDLPTYGAK